MKSSLIFFLMNCLVLAGIPRSSQCEANPKVFNAEAKAHLKKLESQNPGLLNQKAGDKPGEISTVGAVLYGLVVTAGVVAVSFGKSLLNDIRLPTLGGGSC